jgi:hypothetical protein
MSVLKSKMVTNASEVFLKAKDILKNLTVD